MAVGNRRSEQQGQTINKRVANNNDWPSVVHITVAFNYESGIHSRIQKEEEKQRVRTKIRGAMAGVDAIAHEQHTHHCSLGIICMQGVQPR